MKLLYILLLIFLCTSSSIAQNYYSKIFFHGIVPKNIKSFPLGNGQHFLYGGNYFPYGGLLGKISSQGNLLWARRLEFSNTSTAPVPRNLHFDFDHNIIMAVPGDYPNNGEVVKMDTSGNIIWSLHFVHALSDVIVTADSNYAVIGQKNVAAAASDFQFYFYLISPNGTVLQSKFYYNSNPFINFNNLDKLTYDLIQHPNGDFYALVNVAGEIAILRVGSTGSFVSFQKFYSCPTQNYLLIPNIWKLLLKSDNTFLICGKDYLTGSQSNLICFNMDDGGNVLWSNSYTTNQWTLLLNAFFKTDSTVVLFAEAMDSASTSYSRTNAILEIDPNGNIKNGYRLNYTDTNLIPRFLNKEDDTHLTLTEQVSDAMHINDSTMFTRMDTGYYSPCHTVSYLNFIKTNENISMYASFPLTTNNAAHPVFDTLVVLPRNVSTINACIDNGLPENFHLENLTIFPNPSTGQFNFVSSSAIIEIRIFNMNSQLIIKSIQNIVDLSNQPNGIYTYSAITKNGNVNHGLIQKEN